LERDVDAAYRPEYVQVCSTHLFTLVVNATYACQGRKELCKQTCG